MENALTMQVCNWYGKGKLLITLKSKMRNADFLSGGKHVLKF